MIKALDSKRDYSLPPPMKLVDERKLVGHYTSLITLYIYYELGGRGGVGVKI